MIFLFLSSVQFSRSVVSNSLRPHESRHTRPPCPSPTPEVCPSSWWWHPTISSTDALFSFCPQSCPASGTLPVSQLFSLGDQSIKVSASASVPPMNIQDWLPKYDWLVWSLCCPRDSQESSPASQFENINFSALSLCYGPTLTSVHDYWKSKQTNIALTIQTFVDKVMRYPNFCFTKC